MAAIAAQDLARSHEGPAVLVRLTILKVMSLFNCKKSATIRDTHPYQNTILEPCRAAKRLDSIF